MYQAGKTLRLLPDKRVTVGLEIPLTFKHKAIVFQPHFQEVSREVIESYPLGNEGGRIFLIVEDGIKLCIISYVFGLLIYIIPPGTVQAVAEIAGNKSCINTTQSGRKVKS